MALSDIEVNISLDPILEFLHIDPRKLLRMRLSLKSRRDIYKKIGSFNRANYPIKSTLEKLAGRYESNDDFRGKIIRYWLYDIERGATFSESIRFWVPSQEHMLISASQKSGDLTEGMNQAVNLAEKSRLINKTIRGALMYPIFLLIMCAGLFEMFNSTIAPAYTSILPIDKWPASGQTLYAISHFIHTKSFLLLILMAVMTIVITKTMNIWTGPVRKIFDKIPPWSIFKIKQSTSFMISLSALLKATVPFYNALEDIYELSNKYTKVYVSHMLVRIKVHGEKPSKAINTGLIPAETAGNIEDFGELGKVEEAIFQLAKEDLETSIERIEMAAGLIRTLGMFVVVFIIGWIYMTSNDINQLITSSAQTAH